MLIDYLYFITNRAQEMLYYEHHCHNMGVNYSLRKFGQPGKMRQIIEVSFYRSETIINPQQYIEY